MRLGRHTAKPEPERKQRGTAESEQQQGETGEVQRVGIENANIATANCSSSVLLRRAGNKRGAIS